MSRFILAAFIVFTVLFSVNSQAQDVDSKADVEEIVKEYIAKHPEIVVQAIQEWQRRQQVAQLLPTIQTYRGYLENDPEYPVLGNPDGDVTIVEFFDYRCGYCRRHFPLVMQLLKDDGNIRFIPRQYPVLDRPDQNPVSRIASRAALAAHKQNKFEEYHIAVMSASGSLTEERIYEISGSIGIDVAQMKADMASKILDKNIENSLAIGRDIGFQGTPSYIIGDSVLLGAEGLEKMKAAVARARADKSTGR